MFAIIVHYKTGESSYMSTLTTNSNNGFNATQKSPQNFLPPKKENKKSTSKEYSDPLMKYPLRGFAYSNELGAALSEVSPKVATLLWVPALMYIGADIYDKYKNDETSYSPNGKRGMKQAIFQACSGVVLPTMVIYVGQKIFSGLTILGKDKLSAQAKEQTHEFILNYMEQEKLQKYEKDVPKYIANITDAFDTSLNSKRRENFILRPIKRLFNYISDKKNSEALAVSENENLHLHMKKSVSDMFEIREKLMKNEKSDKLSNRLFKYFEKIKPSLKEKYGENDYLAHAAKSVLNKYQKNQMFKQKMIKTIGGFIALGLMAKPIDNFVTNVIMKDAVEPSFKFASTYFNNNNEIKDFCDKTKQINKKSHL